MRLLITEFLSSSTAASGGERGPYIEVKTEKRKILYEALRRVLPSPSDAPVILVISKWRIIITTKIYHKFEK